MKKFVCVFIIIVLLVITLTTIGFADDFSIRGNINFNTTKDEIIAYEKSQGNDIRENPENVTLCNYYTDNCIVCDSISYAGYDKCRVIYYFDDNDTLISVIYFVRFFGDEGEQYIPDALARLDNALNDKYGAIIEKPIAFTKSEKALGFVDFINGLQRGGHANSYKQRLFKLDDYYVEIEIGDVFYFDGEAMTGIVPFDYAKTYAVAISYTKIENEVVDKLLKDADDAQQALDSDL